MGPVYRTFTVAAGGIELKIPVGVADDPIALERVRDVYYAWLDAGEVELDRPTDEHMYTTAEFRNFLSEHYPALAFSLQLRELYLAHLAAGRRRFSSHPDRGA